MDKGIQLITIGAIFTTISNYCMRRSIDEGESNKAFLVIQLMLVFPVAILLNPVRTKDYKFSHRMAVFAIITGTIFAFMQASLGKALEYGPAGLTFAVVSSAAVMPMIVMVSIFGRPFGFNYTICNGIGSVLVMLGLFWEAKTEVNSVTYDYNAICWLIFVTLAFILQVSVLVLMQWRALFIQFPFYREQLYLPFDAESAKSQWFMPIMFGTAALINLWIFIYTRNDHPTICEFLYGAFGGLSNSLGSFFMILATEIATPLEHAMLFPISSVEVMIMCNVWGQLLYGEQVNWLANACCVLGVLIGSFHYEILRGFC
ncbi:6747_t:CDS:1 [Ambispora gerdemannii]|uniref:6747_t:CDS:1 n=1 Tax=Ambispora gerdemannii TaxID=144530 RepID=A0A9N9C1Z4_9GLOM|nr:6747_t:CDS:1 [Ambispora gerdemannii]